MIATARFFKGTTVASAVPAARAAFSSLGIAACCAVGVASIAGCADTGPFVWAKDVNAPTTSTNDADFRLRDTDTVYVHVFNQDNLSTHERVRPDGKISVPTVGEVMARGRRPSELAKELEVKLKNMVVAPSVAVSVDQTAQINVSVMGEVKNAGTFTIDGNSSILVALADAGGLNDFASSDRIFLVRRGMGQRIRFRLADLEEEKKSSTFALQPGDCIVVE